MAQEQNICSCSHK